MNLDVQQQKSHILAQVKAGTLEVELAIKQLKSLKDQLSESHQQSYYIPSWKTAAIDSTQSSTQSPGGEVLICNSAYLAQQALVANRSIKQAAVCGERGWRCIEQHQQDDLLGLQVYSLMQTLNQWDQSGLQIEHVLILLQADSPAEVLQCSHDLLDIIQWRIASKIPTLERCIVSTCGAYADVAVNTFSGLLRTLKVEQPDMAFTLLHPSENVLDVEKQLSMMQVEANSGVYTAELRYTKQGRQIPDLLLTAPSSAPKTSLPTTLLDSGQHWLITGANGGVAKHLIRYGLAQKIKHITLVGRSPASDEIETLLTQHHDCLYYDQADVSQQQAFSETLSRIEQHYGPVDVLFHTAGSLEDCSIDRVSHEQLDKVFSPKYQGLASALHYYANRAMPNMVLFSSIAAYLPHFGQSLYAGANRAMVALAQDKIPQQKLWALHWPLWKEGGMQITASDRELMREETGMLPMASEHALNALQVLAAGEHLLLNGETDNIQAFLKRAQKNMDNVLGRPEPAMVYSGKKIETILIALLSQATQTPVEKITPDLSLQALGLESMIITRLNLVLEKQFGALPKTLLFDCQRVSDVITYISQHTQRHIAEHHVSPEMSDKKDTKILPPSSSRPNQVIKASYKKIDNKPISNNDIAIIGLSGRYPHSNNIDAFWQNLIEGYDAIIEIPKERWPLDNFFDPNKKSGRENSKSYAKWGSFIDGVDEFDSLFFSISPREAAAMDPQERLFLQQVWHLLENAGYSIEKLHQLSKNIHGSTAESMADKQNTEHHVGVYVGVTSGQYQQLSAQDWGAGEKHLSSASYWSIANRVSYFLDIHGPSIALDSACSSSLSAIQMACDALRTGRIRYAIAGGTSINLDPCRYIALSEMNFLSSDGRCRSFGEGGDGYVPGEGVGAVLLKPLADAQHDGDKIYAVIRGGASNHGGKTHGYTVPNSASQGRLIKRALADANVAADDIAYVEAHGTGTSLGDAVEIEGLRQAMESTPLSSGGKHKEKTPIYIGSLKSNIGHLEAAAGIAGLTKLALQLHHQTLVSSLHHQPPNPNLDLDNSRFFVQTVCQPWTTQHKIRVGGISSFGAGGSNAHLIVAESPPNPPTSSSHSLDVPLALFSAFNFDRLKLLCKSHVEWIQQHQQSCSLADYLYNLQSTRTALPTRLALSVNSWADLAKQLTRLIHNGMEQSPQTKRLFEHEVQHNAGHLDTLHTLNIEDLSNHWLNGANIQWTSLWQERHKIIDMPLYPFAKPKHWYKQRETSTQTSITANTQTTQQDTVFDEITFENIHSQQTYLDCYLKSNSPMLDHHHIGGSPVLSGMGQLCLVMEAAKYKGYMAGDLMAGYEFSQTYWLRPLISHGDDLHCHIHLIKNDKALTFKICNLEGLVCCKGTLQPLAPLTQTHPERITIVNRLNVSGDDMYSMMEDKEYCYGPYYQGVKNVTYNSDYAQCQLIAPSKERYCVAPEFLDASLHSIFAMQLANKGAAAVPYYVESIKVYRNIHYMSSADISRQHKSNEQEQCYHVNTYDKDGHLCVAFKHFMSKDIIPASFSTEPTLDKNSLDQHCYIPIWVNKSALIDAKQTPTKKEKTLTTHHLILSSDLSLPLAQSIGHCCERLGEAKNLHLINHKKPINYREIIKGHDSIWFLLGVVPQQYNMADTDFVANHVNGSLVELLMLSQALLNDRKNKRSLHVITNNCFKINPEDNAFNALSAGFIGFAKTLAAEASHIRISFSDIDAKAGKITLEPSVFEKIHSYSDALPLLTSAYRDGHCYQEKFISVEGMQPSQPSLQQFRMHGVYLIVGGASGLGLATARYLKQNYKAQVVLVGRRPKAVIDTAITHDFDYYSADICQPDIIKSVVASVQKKYGSMQGVIHSALTLEDKSIAQMSVDALNRVLSVKVQGTIALLEALMPVKLDFVLIYSSSISQTCSAGQSNYAAASCIQDALAHYYQRNKQVIKVVNWGYWSQTGIVATEDHQTLIEKKGVLGISVDEGLAWLEKWIRSPHSQTIALKLNAMGMARWQPYVYSPLLSEPVMLENYWDAKKLTNQWDAIFPADNKASGELINQYCQQQVLSILQQYGIFSHANNGFNIQKIQQALSVVASPSKLSLLHAILDMLERANIIQYEAKQWQSTGVLATTITRQEVLSADPSAQGYIRLLDHCLSQLIDLFQGRASDTEILFPKGSSELVEALYRDNPISNACNNMVAILVKDRVKRLISQGQTLINIVEIGAGTASTTLSILPLLKPYAGMIRYYFTDLSSHFVMKAKNRFAQEYPWLDAVVLDVSAENMAKEIQSTGIEPCDILLASNVLHATGDIAKTLGNCSELLKQDASIMINEVTRNWDFVTLTFGLTTGWWLFNDPENRLPYSPLLSPKLWQQQLNKRGYNDIMFYGNSEENYSLGQSVIAARYGAPVDSSASTEPQHAGLQTAKQVRLVANNDDVIEPIPAPEMVSAPASLITSVATTAPSMPTTVTMGTLTTVFNRVLGISLDDLEDNMPFQAMGLDSIVFPELLDQLQLHYPLLNLPELMAANTLGRLSEIVEQQYAQNNNSVAVDHSTNNITENTPRSTYINTARSTQVLANKNETGKYSDKNKDEKNHTRPQEKNTQGQSLNKTQEIAIIGVAGKYPGADNLSALWSNIVNAKSQVSGTPDQRWWESTDPQQRAAFLADVDAFDPLFFGISPREASQLDPQQKLILQTVWHCLEDAAYSPEKLNNQSLNGVGVYLASMYQHYGQLAAEQWAKGKKVAADSSLWAIANRVSHCFNFHGPSMGLDSACSGGLLSIKMACDGIRMGHCDTAIAGGVNLILHPGHHQSLRQAKMLSDSDQCKPFDPQADGMVSGEGAGVVLLKDYEQALADNDNIYGVICGDACNYKGYTSDGFTVPSAEAEQNVMNKAWQQAGITIDNIAYLEVQATGIERGDQAEAQAISQFLSTKNSTANIRLGSIKTHLGHLEAASGVAQLTHVLLQFKHKCWLPTPHAYLPDSLKTHCYIGSQADHWNKTIQSNTPKYAGVSSFGAGGTNVHLAIRNQTDTNSSSTGVGHVADHGIKTIFPLSARKPEQLQQIAKRLLKHIEALSQNCTEHLLEQIAYTLQTGRQAMKHRTVVVAHTVEELVQQLSQYTNAVTMADQHQAQLSAALTDDIHHWLAGGDVTWDDYYKQTTPKALSLPGYPFATVRGWLYAPERVLDTPIQVRTESMTIAQEHDTNAKPKDALMSISLSIDEAQSQICQLISKQQAIPLNEIDPTESMESYGFDSIAYFNLAEQLSKQFTTTVAPTLFYQLHTPDALAAHFSAQSRRVVASPTTSNVRDATLSSNDVLDHKTMTAAEDKQSLSGNEQAGDLAIIGMAGKFPGSNNIDEFWQNLLRGDSYIDTVPKDRFDASAIKVTGIEEAFDQGGFVSDIDQFDHEFFKLSPREAKLMDPQHRLMLQSVYDCIADAGYLPEHFSQTQTGIFVGVAANDYGALLVAAGEEIDGQLATGNVHSTLVNRISYFLNITGPSEPINTACSSSLVAVHRAAQSIRSGECTQALVGGVNLMIGSAGHEAFAKAGMLSPTGACHSFDAKADGYARGEGCATILIKPLAQAQRDGDFIQAIIKGSATAHAGKASSLTAPNPDAQAKVINAALSNAQLPPEAISYIETHGTGTQLGDPIEIDGLKKVFSHSIKDSPSLSSCSLGALKSEIGHLETAAGIAGLIKVVLSLRHQIQLPIRHLQQDNDLIDLSDSRLTLLRQLRPWPVSEKPRYAGISSFGFGGVNAHVILQEAPVKTQTKPANGVSQLATFSAPTQSQLLSFVQHFQAWLVKQENPSIDDICYTLQCSRSQYAQKLAMQVDDISDLKRGLSDYLGQQSDTTWFASSEESQPVSPLLKQDFEVLEQVAKKEHNLPSLARLWCSGAKIQLPLLDAGRVSIPTIPFAGHRHWFSNTQQTKSEVLSTPTPKVMPVKTPDKVESPVPDAPVTTKSIAENVGVIKNKTAPPPNEKNAASTTAVKEEKPVNTTIDSAAVYNKLLEIITTALGMALEKLDKDKPFPEYGVDSISSLRIMQIIQQHYGDSIPMTAIIEEPTLHRLSQFVFAHYSQNAHVEKHSELTSIKPVDETIQKPFSIKINPFKSLKNINAQPKHGALFMPSVTGEQTWSLHWINVLDEQNSYQLNWSLHQEGIDRIAFIQAVAQTIKTLNLSHITLYSHGHMAYFTIAVAHEIAAISDSVLALHFVEPEHSDQLSLKLALKAVETQCQMVWGKPSKTNTALVSTNDLQVTLKNASQGIMQDSQFTPWFVQVSNNIEYMLPVLQNFQPKPWVNVEQSYIIQSGGNHVSGLVQSVVPPAQCIYVQDCDIYSAEAAKAYQQKNKAPIMNFPLVHINPQGKNTPSFWIHTLLGDVSFALNLSYHLGKSWPLYGVEQFAVDGTLSLLPSVEDMASHYIRSIQASNPNGPYTLGGYSFGGAVAYEMCRQLSRQGHKVDQLILLDSFMPNTDTFNSIDVSSVETDSFDVMALLMVANNFAQRYKVEEEILLEHVTGLSQDQQFSTVANVLLTGETQQTHAQLYELVKNNYNTILSNNNALLSYEPKVLDADIQVVLFHATQGFIAEDNIYGMPEVAVTETDRSNGFSPYVPQGLTIIDIDADHYSICHEKNIEKLVNELKTNDRLFTSQSNVNKEKKHAV